MRRFFIDPNAITDATAIISGPEARHIRTVLRLEQGEIIALFDGTGAIHEARIDQVDKDSVTCAILSSRTAETSGPALHLGQALLTGQKMDLVVQKTTELGVAGIHPFTAKRCTAGPIKATRQSRWQRIAFEACKQCGRPAPPEIASLTDLDTLLSLEVDHDLKLLFYEEEQATGLMDVAQTLNKKQPPASVLFLIGPEGGFTAEETTRAKAAGFLAVSLGPRILRAETASIAAAAILQFLLDQMGAPTKGDKSI